MDILLNFFLFFLIVHGFLKISDFFEGKSRRNKIVKKRNKTHYQKEFEKQQKINSEKNNDLKQVQNVLSSIKEMKKKEELPYDIIENEDNTNDKFVLDTTKKNISSSASKNQRINFSYYNDIYTAAYSLGYTKSQIDKAIKKVDYEFSKDDGFEIVLKRILDVIK
tara:strand:+ start:197 stop:691 length:495 start_codon:yes stop_codon:yes gene_type:complete